MRFPTLFVVVGCLTHLWGEHESTDQSTDGWGDKLYETVLMEKCLLVFRSLCRTKVCKAAVETQNRLVFGIWNGMWFKILPQVSPKTVFSVVCVPVETNYKIWSFPGSAVVGEEMWWSRPFKRSCLFGWSPLWNNVSFCLLVKRMVGCITLLET